MYLPIDSRTGLSALNKKYIFFDIMYIMKDGNRTDFIKSEFNMKIILFEYLFNPKKLILV